MKKLNALEIIDTALERLSKSERAICEDAMMEGMTQRIVSVYYYSVPQIDDAYMRHGDAIKAENFTPTVTSLPIMPARALRQHQNIGLGVTMPDLLEK